MTDSIKKSSNAFQTKFALFSTAATMAMLITVGAIYTEWKLTDFYPFYGRHRKSDYRGTSSSRNYFGQNRKFHWNARGDFAFLESMNRNLEEDENNTNNNNEGNENGGNDGDYSSYRCADIFTFTDPPSNEDGDDTNNSNGPSQRCRYAQTCESDGILFPFIFCNNSVFSTTSWLIMLSPFLLLGLTILFRLLGTTAEDYFSPSLEMFSLKLGLPPRFAGVTLLALGNGAADVSATINAIASDPENGYLMSLGALTGAAMFITTCIAGAVIVVNEGLVCRGALVRDVAMLGITVTVVGLELRKGEVGPGTERTFISIYIAFVLTVLVADIYHRAVMLPRIQKQLEMRERERQVEAEKWASTRAGEVLNSYATAGGSRADRLEGDLNPADKNEGDVSAPIGQSDTYAFENNRSPLEGAVGDIRSCASAPPQLEEMGGPAMGNRALNAVLLALSNYNENDDMEDSGMDNNRPNGWGVESTSEGGKSWDRPVVLHGADGILTRHHGHHHGVEEEDGMDAFQSPYRVMEDMDLVDRLCVQEGSIGIPNVNWHGAFQDGKQELIVHFRQCWMDIFDDEDNSALDKLLLVCEFPFTVFRKLSISIPCDGSYCRALVAISLAFSPIWAAVYLMENFDINLWGLEILIMLSIMLFFGLMVLRFAPTGDGTMSTIVAVPIALYGFMVAATWIDAIADKLVALLEFLGLLLRINKAILGLTILAWGNSMADLSANLTMARKGLANMAITACFAGPVFNILVGLGAGFGVLRGVNKTEVNYVHLTPSITTGFVFCFLNCGILLISGLLINKGVIPVGYGYVAISMYVLYIAASLLSSFLI
mmetsp:Transcript_1163/g.2414  ORF Transcript_1163/g.2414 Transcript_1163/m.2414 type:complete len:829 (-) Transcript_1163:186-2672(-)